MRDNLRLLSGIRALAAFILISIATPAIAQSNPPSHHAWDQWMRGQIKAANVPLSISPQGLSVLKNNWGVNAIRVQVVLDDAILRTIAEGKFAADDRVRRRIGELLDAADRQKLGVILDLHRPEGGSEGSKGRLWSEPPLHDRLVAVWKTLASAFKDHPAIIAYDILNEPTPPDDFTKAFSQIRGSMQDWNVLARKIVAAIRDIDRNVPLIVETTDWAKPFRFRQLEKINDEHIVYSFHMYFPFELTHQGVRQFEKKPDLNYPGIINGRRVDKDELGRYMHDAVAFAETNRVPLFVGEFGINKYAPAEARRRYVKDLLDFFTEKQWSWAYHAFQIWDGWMPDEFVLDEIVSHTRK